MNNNDITKALKCCVKMGCRKCEYNVGAATCIKNLMVDTADLINRQKAEIERLQNTLNDVLDRQPTLVERSEQYAKAEAIKEFAERLKDFSQERLVYEGYNESKLINIVEYADIDNLVKEMVGE